MASTQISISEDKTAKLAILIDADNASAQNMENILQEITKFGEATVKRIYGNFVGGGSNWKNVINRFAIKPMQQFAYTTGKNATDSFLIIDAMDLLYKNLFDGFCIVSSDSDFTALAIRLREEGKIVYGFGKKQTPESFRNACTQFIYVENLIEIPQTQVTGHNTEQEKSNIEQKTEESLSTELSTLPTEIIRKIFEQQDDEWITAAVLGQQWKLLKTDFDARSYGYKNLTDLIKQNPNIFDIKEITNSSNTYTNLYTKLKIK
ncbi:NYN domain-containing protein [Stenoxybacter acetivorans]|uniref:NYN domain-containing protein n=1 Tax=Stenoxybacter acetivorans TaxID=422441 RepID=UPI00055B1FED|nr:NYN domain-containing protein [Stenoxybacter acetivorans]